MVVVHQDALSTLNGTRDCALVSATIEALDKKKLGGIGNWLFTPVPAAKEGY